MSDKLDMTSPDLVSQNIEKIRTLFPNCVTESANGLAIDFDQLKQELSKDIVEGNKERYRLEWPGKREAIVTANLPINKTLRPAREESVDFDNTENLYIEGDNLEVLKLLQESYLGKIKMIYIDPPYNTGKDFVYKDNFTQDTDEYQEEAGLKDEYNNRLVANPDTSGRYHSDWLTMMYPRLKLARNLLTDDGVIFISIDDNEVHNLRKISDEVFGEGNLIAQICHKARASVSNDKIISSNHNHILFYAKDQNIIFQNRKNIGLKPNLEGFDKSDEKGFYKLVPVDGPGGAKKGNPYYEFEGIIGYWRFSKERMTEMFKNGQVVKTTNNLQQKYYLKDAENSRRTATTWWDENLYTSTATGRLKTLMNSGAFDTPKPIELLEKMLELSNTKNDIILDFFSGSATTAHSVMQLNSEDGGNRKFIMVQVPERTDEKSEAFKAGYDNICEIGKERIRRAAKKIKEETKSNVDYGFRVYKLDSSNMQDVYYTPNQYEQGQLDLLEDNIKPDRNSDDLVAQIMLDWGLPLSLKIEQTKIANKEVFKVADDALLCCFDEGIDEAFAKEIATLKPLRIVFRDKSFKDDTAKENVKQLLKQLSPDSEMKVI
ncbi:site-specific DNA-methyltransferase [Flavobacterium sp.]|jgi:adenine-specific DNA-methyltransferase|uniref:site-specific DNA-methyltransferase n=1 Tax=Flavobacterium sp. TaxID=239 RepID=UPI0037C02D15